MLLTSSGSRCCRGDHVGHMLRIRIADEYYFQRKSAMDEDEILNCLAPSLRRDVLTHLLGKSVAKIQIFAPLDTDTQLEIQPMLKPVRLIPPHPSYCMPLDSL